MKELAAKFIEKECIISSFDGSHQYEGVIKEVTDGAILVEKDGKIMQISLEKVPKPIVILRTQLFLRLVN